MSAVQKSSAAPAAAELRSILKGGYCVGCGGCAVANPEAIAMRRNEFGAYEAVIRDDDPVSRIADAVCPFSGSAPDEDRHADRLFGAAPMKDERLGRFEQTYAGSVREGDYRAEGSSGGATSWVAAELMREGMIDAVVHVRATGENASSGLFEYRVSRTIGEIRSGAKTRYYSVSMADAMRAVSDEGLRIAFVGVPCFVTALRNLAVVDERIERCVRFTIAIFCGHMKAPGFAESLAWQVGVAPRNIAAVDFRVKLPERTANDYGFSAVDRTTLAERSAPMTDLAGRRWDGGYFKLKACEYCDDVAGETADVAFGDAWLPEYVRDSKGTNVCIVRNPVVRRLIDNAIAAKRLDFAAAPADRVVASQSAAFRDRRDALKYRLWLADRRREWRPVKRVEPARDHLSALRRVNLRLRQFVRRRSFISFRFAKKTGLLQVYRLEMIFYHGVFKLLGIAEQHLGPRR